MLRLPYRPEYFGAYMGSALTQVSEISFTWDELIRAAITVGRRNWSDVLRHGTYSILEGLWRVAIVRANLIEEPDGRLGESSAFRDLDPSERGAISYFLGLTFTKLIADKLFFVPWLLHLDVYRQDLNPHLALPVKPDFVGMDAHQQWLVAESKGRTSPVGRQALEDAKRQTRSLRNLNGALPALRIAVGTYFTSGMSRARIWDPDELDNNAVDLPIPLEEFARAYYRPLVEIVEQLPPAETRTIGESGRGVQLSGLDAVLRLDKEILAWYHGNGSSWDEILAARRTVPSVLQQIVELRRMAESDRQVTLMRDTEKRDLLGSRRLQQPSFKGLDGVYLELGPSWNEEFMRREPEDRGR